MGLLSFNVKVSAAFALMSGPSEWSRVDGFYFSPSAGPEIRRTIYELTSIIDYMGNALYQVIGGKRLEHDSRYARIPRFSYVSPCGDAARDQNNRRLAIGRLRVVPDFLC